MASENFGLTVAAVYQIYSGKIPFHIPEIHFRYALNRGWLTTTKNGFRVTSDGKRMLSHQMYPLKNKDAKYRSEYQVKEAARYK